MQPAITQGSMVTEDNVEPDIRQREELELVKAFLGIKDPGKRRRILELAERLADDADAAELAFTPTDGSLAEASKEVPSRTE